MNDIQNSINYIRKMSHEEMAWLHRFAPSGHPYFDITSPLNEAFQARFKMLGGMTTEISKKIGW